jgi:hypothetical protein
LHGVMSGYAALTRPTRLPGRLGAGANEFREHRT